MESLNLEVFLGNKLVLATRLDSSKTKILHQAERTLFFLSQEIFSIC